jgi:hypothetical protein
MALSEYAKQQFLGHLHDGTAVYKFSNANLLNAWYIEQAGVAARNGDAPEPPPDIDTSSTDPADGETPVYAEHILTRSALRNLPDPEPLIGNVLDQGTCSLLYGHRGTYKTFIGIDWAASVATGRNWQGRPVAQRRTLYVAAEGAFGFKGRIDAWETGWDKVIADGELDILPHPVNLTRALEVANLTALIGWGGYGFVVLDTLARCMVGADENSARDIGTVVDHLYRLLDSTPQRRGVILGVHHTGKDGRTLRGSSAFEGGVDTVYSVTRDSGFTTPARTGAHCAAPRRSRAAWTPCTRSPATACRSSWTGRNAKTAPSSTFTG